ncbi:surface carbohydrate biosynthesis protein [Candidatus Pelagibacter bacterium nBUS_49]|uniref:surface carbohydrate biosynthesis protein n=1 Tax=Candidatus Pelagibacter bacterium nBUS_49 TaxID=3374196 RepID=UPI003EBE571C
MNIYIHFEILVREFDSKLLLALLAASKGHDVIISDISGIEKGLKTGFLKPGIFHTKSLTPTKKKLNRHKKLFDKGFVISSIDEEAGIDIKGYEQFSKTRYSEKMIELASIIFAWGIDDYEVLRRKYPKYKKKFFKTGSPRVDMWKPLFSDFWKSLVKVPKKPYLLISSNMGWANNEKSFYKLVQQSKNAGYYIRDSNLIKEHFGRTSEHYLTTASFIRAIKYLSKYNNGYDIVLRPHPSESIEAWKLYLEDIPNVHVIREDSISAWVNNAFAVMHNGCTTAIETTISNKPLLTYIPFKQNYSDNLPNELGNIIKSPQELLKKANKLFNSKIKNNQKEKNFTVPNFISDKILIDEKELAAEKIVKIWEKFANDRLSESSNLLAFKLYLKINNIKQTMFKLIKKIFLKENISTENQKIPPLKRKKIINRIDRIKKILFIEDKFECKMLSNRTILIKKI